MDEASIKNHVIYKYASEVTKIGDTLFSLTPINYFCICRFYKNGDYSGLLSSQSWAHTYLKHDYQNLGLEHYIASQITGIFFWNLTTFDLANKKGRAVYQSLADHRQGSGVFIVEDSLDYKEVGIFTTPNHTDSNDPYLINNLGLIKNFILFFKDKLNENKKLLSAYEHRYQRHLPKQTPIAPREDIEYKFPIRKYQFDNQFYRVRFSKREAECLKYLFYGKTAKEIARELELSPRTIETYFENIKRKTLSDDLSEVCRKLASCFLLDGI